MGIGPMAGDAPLDMAELGRLVEAGEVSTVVCAFSDSYGRQLGKRLDARFFVDQAAAHGTHACDYLLTVDLAMEPIAGYGFASWEQGYGDMHLIPDPATLRRAGWSPETAWVICDLADTTTDQLIEVAPRTVLQRQLERADQMGVEPMSASELEFFIYHDTYRDLATGGYERLNPAGWYIEDYHLLQGARVEPYIGEVRRALTASGIAVESSKGEWGRGQHEINIAYRPTAEMADHHSVMKHAMKEIADRQGIAVTFMAKPHTDEAGSSCHVHLSLWNNGQNLFVAPDGSVSDTFRWFLGGWMHHAAELMVMYAPTINSYKRYQDGSWAPTALAWSTDNRTTGFRIVGHDQSLRIECRIPGADVNPYLLYAAVLASGLDGLEHRIEPPPHFDGDAYSSSDLTPLPTTLSAATNLFIASDFARRTFGEAVVEHYGHFFATEVAASERAVTDFERSRYFEQI
jgi:glutamine synthetase